MLNYSSGRDCELLFHGDDLLDMGAPPDRAQPAHAPTEQVCVHPYPPIEQAAEPVFFY